MVTIKFKRYLDFLALTYDKYAKEEAANIQGIDAEKANLGDVILGLVYQSRSDNAAGAAEVLRRLTRELPDDILNLDIDLEELNL